VNVNARVVDDGLRRMLGRLPTIVEREIVIASETMGKEHVTSMIDRMRGDGAGLVKKRTGFLQDRFTTQTRRVGGIGGIRTRVFVAGVKYADIQERGGVIRPKNRKYLTVPLAATKTAGGAIKGQYAGGAGAYRDTGAPTFVFKSKKGGLFIAERTGKKGKLALLWKLVTSVRIPGNLGWYRTWRENASQRRSILDATARRIVQQARGA
jgi:hypothetical protein